jgi:hypothetical protein
VSESEPPPSLRTGQEKSSPNVSRTGNAKASKRSIANSGFIGSLAIQNHYYTGVVVALLLAGIAVGLGILYSGKSRTTIDKADTPPAVPIDVRMHEIWPSSSENMAVRLEYKQWIATDFLVSQPYLRSVEVAAAKSSGGLVLLQVYDSDNNEIVGQEIAVSEYRAKVVFDAPVSVRKYLGRRLFFSTFANLVIA